MQRVQRTKYFMTPTDTTLRSVGVLFFCIIVGFMSHLVHAEAGRSNDPRIELTQTPVDFQLYPRDDQGFGHVVLAGTVSDDEFDVIQEIRIDVSRDNEPYLTRIEPLQFSDDSSAAFHISIPIRAERKSYDFTASLVKDETEAIVIVDADNLVAGDVYLIQGQSNAVAGDFHNENLANQSQRPWIRSFGTASTIPQRVRKDLGWHLADGESFNKSGTVGTWALRMAQLLVDEYGIPIGLINGAVGGTNVWYHLRNDRHPYDLTTNYGRLLFRTEAAGVRTQAKAIFWYQGESDGGTKTWDYYERLRNLALDWHEDYPGVQHLYVIQVREGCGLPPVSIREVHRRIADIWPGTSVMSTNGLPAHDGCHYRYLGYRNLGDWLSRLVARDFYGAVEQEHIDAPNPSSAEYTSSARDEILIRFRDADDELIWEDGAHEYFLLHGGGTIGIIDGAVVGPGAIRLQLSGTSNATAISYQGHANDGPFVRSSKRVGLLSFHKLPISR